MASPASPEASEVRRRGQRRLIGAVAIVLLLVVFVPMVLDDEPRTANKGPDTTIPPRDKAPPLPAPAAPASAPPAVVAPSPAMKAATPNPSKTPSPLATVVPPEAVKAPQEGATAAAEAQHAVVEPVATAKKAELLKPEAMKPAEPKADGKPSPRPSPKGEGDKAAPKLEGFAVQVGAFRDEDRIKAVREKLAAAGVVHYTERLDSPNGPITRLRAGPFPTRAGADAAMGKIKAVAPDAKVVPLP
jgi:DedD protein